MTDKKTEENSSGKPVDRFSFIFKAIIQDDGRHRHFIRKDHEGREAHIPFLFSFISHNSYFFFIFKGHHNNRKNKQKFFREKTNI